MMAQLRSGDVDWYEGLYVRRQHLQLFQRQTLAALAEARDLGEPFAAGLLEPCQLTPASDGLRVEHLRAILPGGALLDVPRFADVAPLPLGSITYPATVYAVVDPAQPLAVEDVPVADDNAPATVELIRVKRLSARLTVDPHEGTSVGLAIARLTAADKLDAAFIPTCRYVQAAPVLHERLDALVVSVAALEAHLQDELRAKGFRVETPALGDLGLLLRCGVATRARTRLTALRAIPRVPPFHWYVETATLYNELVSNYLDEGLAAAPAYVHNNPADSLGELVRMTEALVTLARRDRITILPFTRVDQGGVRFLVTLTRDQLREGLRFWLGIETTEPPGELVARVTQAEQLQLTAPTLAAAGLFAVPLKAEESTPDQIPAKPQLHVFRLQPENKPDVWQLVKQESGLEMRWRAAVVPARVSLFIDSDG
jgi:predicted component of type VI protein secretion system